MAGGGRRAHTPVLRDFFVFPCFFSLKVSSVVFCSISSIRPFPLHRFQCSRSIWVLGLAAACGGLNGCGAGGKWRGLSIVGAWSSSPTKSIRSIKVFSRPPLCFSCFRHFAMRKSPACRRFDGLFVLSATRREKKRTSSSPAAASQLREDKKEGTQNVPLNAPIISVVFVAAKLASREARAPTSPRDCSIIVS